MKFQSVAEQDEVIQRLYYNKTPNMTKTEESEYEKTVGPQCYKLKDLICQQNITISSIKKSPAFTFAK